MKDQWMEGMMVLASESDILESITNEQIIDTVAQISVQLRKALTFK